MNFKRKQNKGRRARRSMLLKKWGKGATRQNKIYYGDSGVIVALLFVKE
jgi:hypothetical protein